MAEVTLIKQDARMSRQAQIVHADLASAQVLVGGVGMLGSFTALALAHCVRHVAVWDPDVVEDVNAGNQLYDASHWGLPKGEALERMTAGFPLSSTHSIFPLESAPEALLPHPREEGKLIVISGADSFKVRADLAAYALHHEADVFVDTRAMGSLAIVCVVPRASIEQYLAHEVIKDEDAPDVPCGMNGTAYMGCYVAGRVVAGLNSHFRGGRVPFIRVEDIDTQDVLRCDYPEAEEVKVS